MIHDSPKVAPKDLLRLKGSDAREAQGGHRWLLQPIQLSNGRCIRKNSNQETRWNQSIYPFPSRYRYHQPAFIMLRKSGLPL